MKKIIPIVFAIIAILICILPAHAGDLIVDVNADVDAFGNDQMSSNYLASYQGNNNTVYALPTFNDPVGNHTQYWDNMVEQYDAAGVNGIAVWLKSNNQPATFANAVSSINKRGDSGTIKIMPFDDNPASWTAMANYQKTGNYNYSVPFDVSNTANWVYVWDQNLKVFWQNVPDANRYKIKGRPVYAIWSAGSTFLSNLNGNGSKLLNYIRSQAQATFGFNPYIIVPEDWIPNDPSSGAAGVVDAVFPWFTPVPGNSYSEWNVNTYNGVKLGCCVPEFRISNNADPNSGTWWIDPKNGNTLANGLNNTIGTGCAMTLVEGFDDYWENTTCWRAANVSASGGALTYAQTYYDYPNERIDILRQHSNNPFPANLKFEAEGCDSFQGGVSGGGVYRNGAIAVQTCGDTGGGWNVCGTQLGEALTWTKVPFAGASHIYVRVATIASGKAMHIIIDGTRYPSVTVPNTGNYQVYQTVDMGSYPMAVNSYHTVQIVWEAPDINLNWWQL